jgi:hypothetical protein
MKISTKYFLNLILMVFAFTTVHAKDVGVAYSPWFMNSHWASEGGCTWGDPAIGSYRSDDLRAIDQHIDWLADAGVDFVMMDWSNNWNYTPGGTQDAHIGILERSTHAFVDRLIWRKNNGQSWIKVAIMIGGPFDASAYQDGRIHQKVMQVKSEFLDDPDRRSVYYEHRGKPLLVDYTQGIFNYNDWDHSAYDGTFTIRRIFATLIQNNLYDAGTMRSRDGLWSWSENVHPPAYSYDGRPEAVTIHPALRTCGWYGPESYNQVDQGLKDCIDNWGGAKGRRNGDTFREGWQYAHDYNVDLAMVMAFNEWTGCEASDGEQRNQEYSIDIEPMAGGHGDLYLRILKEEVARFKGAPVGPNGGRFVHPGTYWEFNDNLEGWNGESRIDTASGNGVMKLTIKAADPYIHSSPRLYVNSQEYPYLVFRIKNRTTDTRAELLWTTDVKTGYDGSNHKYIEMVPNDNQFREYSVYMADHAGWTSIIRQLRLDPVQFATSGTVEVDFIGFSKSGQIEIPALSSSSLLSSSSSGGGATTKVYILSGQSNMNGNVAAAHIPDGENVVHNDVLAWIGESIEDLCIHGEPCPAPRSTIRQWRAMQLGYGYDWSGFAGPELSLTSEFKKLRPQDNFAIIKYNRPGQSLQQFYRPPSSGPLNWDAIAGTGYRNLIGAVEEALSTLGTTDYEIVGFAWIQGESDMGGAGSAQEYESNLRNLIADLRRDLNAPNMAMAIAKTLPEWASDLANATLVRNAQQSIADEDPRIGIFDPSTDRIRFPVGQGDWHFQPTGSWNLGVELARTLNTVLTPISSSSSTSSSSNSVSSSSGDMVKPFWNFTTGTEGWAVTNQLELTASSGLLNLDITGNDPYIHSPNDLGISLSEYSAVAISMQNQTADTVAELFWITTTSSVYDGVKMIQFPIVANDSGQRLYLIDLSNHPEWHDILKQLRFDPIANLGSGSQSIDYIKLVGGYASVVHSIPGIVEAENFNIGGEDNAYFDADVANSGGAYRTFEGVDIEATSDLGGGYNVGWLSSGEWLEYIVDVTSAGSYEMDLRVAAASDANTIRVDFNREDKSGVLTINSTGYVQQWTTFTQQVTLEAGLQIMRVQIPQSMGGFNINWLGFRKVDDAPTTILQSLTLTKNRDALQNYNLLGQKKSGINTTHKSQIIIAP